MTIAAFEIVEYLPANPQARINVVFADSPRVAFAAKPAGIRSMAAHHMIAGEINKHGYLKFVRLLVPVGEARRIERTSEIDPDWLPRGITRMRQKRGATKWVERLDKARTGLVGGQRSVFVGGRGE